MNHRERVLAALEHRSPDRPPRDLGSTTATGIHPAAYLALKRYLGLPGEAHYLSARAQLVWVEPAVLERLGIDILPVVSDAGGVAPVLDENRAYVDRWGIERRLPEGGGHYYVSRPPLTTAETLADLQAFRFPEPNLDYRGLAETARGLRQSSDRALMLNPEVGFLHQAQFLRGFDRWLIDLVADPAFAAALLDRVLEVWLAETGAMLEQVGAYTDVVIYADDIALQNGLMVSPRTYASLFKPRQKRVFDLLKRSGLKVLYHSCGSVQSLIGDLVDMGVDALNPVQVSARGMDDTAALKRQWGSRLTFWGGIDTQRVLPRGTVDEVRGEVCRRLDDLAAEGGYVLASVHDIQAEVPPENVCAMFDAATEWEGRPHEGNV
jgi:uroporphyrinogen decarboxylase